MPLYAGEWKARGPCQIQHGCVKAAECWIYRIIRFSSLNNRNNVTIIDNTTIFGNFLN